MIENGSWLVLLNSQSIEEELKQVHRLFSIFKPKSIELLFVIEPVDIPSIILSDFPDIQQPDKAKMEKVIEEMVRKSFHPEWKVNSQVIIGNVLKKTLSIARSSKPDLLILPHSENDREAVLRSKITRKSPVSVLTLSGNNGKAIKSVLSVLDLADSSEKVVDEVKVLADIDPSIHFSFLHVYRDSTKYFNQLFDTIDEIEKVTSKSNYVNNQLKEYAKIGLAEFLEDYDLSFGTQMVESISITENESIRILEKIKIQKPDLVIISSKNKATTDADLLSQSTEAIVTEDINPSLLILKNKGENEGFLKNLFGF